MIDIYEHGIGTSCKGDDYHHTVLHAVDDETGMTLCGTEISRHNWFLQKYQRLEVESYKRIGKPKLFDVLHCQKCAKIMQGMYP